MRERESAHMNLKGRVERISVCCIPSIRYEVHYITDREVFFG